MFFLVKKGFTLIEMLVVVLIIGILAAVAFPQYQFALEKVRLTEALNVVAELQEAVDFYLLNEGYPASGNVQLIGDKATTSHLSNKLDVSVEPSLTCDQQKGDYCRSRHFAYNAFCKTDTCSIYAVRHKDGNRDEEAEQYHLFSIKSAETGQWTNTCYFKRTEFPYSVSLCKSLEPRGWKQHS